MIKVDNQKLEARQLSFQDVEDAVNFENMTISGGDVLSDGMRRNVRVVGEFSGVEEILDIIISNQNQNIVYLRDVAGVDFGFTDRTSYSRTNQMPVVTLDIIKRSGENIINAADKIKGIIAQAKAEKFPKELKIELLNDQSIKTRDMLSNLENSIIAGV